MYEQEEEQEDEGAEYAMDDIPDDDEMVCSRSPKALILEPPAPPFHLSRSQTTKVYDDEA